MKLFESYANKIQNSNTPEVFFDNFVYQLNDLIVQNGSKNNQNQVENDENSNDEVSENEN
jgi:hypothetical protein